MLSVGICQTTDHARATKSDLGPKDDATVLHGRSGSNAAFSKLWLSCFDVSTSDQERRKSIEAQFGGEQEENNMTPLEILWRNPYPVRARCRRHRFEREGENSLYVLQEFV